MKLTPRYEGPPILSFTEPAGDLSVPLLRQRRRLGRILEGLDGGQWATPSRCEAWSVQDVVAHLATVDGYWALSATAALAGEPTRFLDGFDPVTIPAEMVDARRDQSPAEVLAAYQAGVEALGGVVSGLDDEQWETVTEAPPGHVALHVMVRHALWDAWIHERDVLLPLGFDQHEEPDEVQLALEYAVAIGTTFVAIIDSSRTGAVAVVAHDPDVRVVAELDGSVTVHRGAIPAGAVVLEGSSIALLEALSERGPLPCAVADEEAWLVRGLAVVFDHA